MTVFNLSFKLHQANYVSNTLSHVRKFIHFYVCIVTEDTNKSELYS